MEAKFKCGCEKIKRDDFDEMTDLQASPQYILDRVYSEEPVRCVVRYRRFLGKYTRAEKNLLRFLHAAESAGFGRDLTGFLRSLPHPRDIEPGIAGLVLALPDRDWT